jgi:hypothetical protein
MSFQESPDFSRGECQKDYLLFRVFYKFEKRLKKNINKSIQ